jgi:N-acetylglucosamine-6-phosphate deacetylase
MRKYKPVFSGNLHRLQVVTACNNSGMQTVYTASRLWDGADVVENPLVVVEDGRIVAMGSRDATDFPAGAQICEFSDGWLAPAFFDVHIHGAAGHDVMEATAGALDSVGAFLASRGTGQYLATTVSASLDATLRSVEGIARLIARGTGEGRARPVGIHLEGPFLSYAKRGVHPPERLMAPDIGVFDRIVDAAEGKVRLMTLAPELPGATELAAHATARGVRVSVGHSDETAAQTRAAIEAGAISATHTFNAMRALDHREPGILGTVLTTDALFAELICDGIHTAPEMVRLWWKAKGAERAILVTDAMSAAGMPEGEYRLGGFAVQVSGGRAMANGVLAGSVLTLDRALENFVMFTGAGVEKGLPLLTRNPAAMTGFSDQVGRLATGGAASFVAVDSNGKLLASVVDGRECLRK